MFLSRFRVILANICIIHPDAFLQAKIWEKEDREMLDLLFSQL